MKKIALLGALLFLANVTFAQHSRVDFGLKAGVNLANLKTETGNPESKTGFHAGGLAHIHLSNSFALQPEVMYSRQGATFGTNNKHELHYLNVPLMAQYMFANGLRLQTGPQVGFLTKSEQESGHNETNLVNRYKKTDFSWSIGTGYVTKSGLGFDARYNHGLNNINQNNSDVKNRVWQLGIFYQFRS